MNMDRILANREKAQAARESVGKKRQSNFDVAFEAIADLQARVEVLEKLQAPKPKQTRKKKTTESEST